MRMNRSVVLAAALGACVALTGCAPRKDAYKPPVPPTPQAWQTGLGAQDAEAKPGAPSATELQWANFFTDPKLREVIHLALENNRDLRIAAINVARFEALYRLQRSQQYPTVNAGASADAYRFPADMTKDDRAYTANTNRVGLQVSAWELDLFGRVRSLKQAALEQYLATEQGRVATQLSLIAAVGSSYLNMAADRDSLRLAQATLDAQKATYDLILQSRTFGMKSDLDLSETRSQVQAAEVDVVRFTGQLSLDKNALDLVVGATVLDDLLPAELGPDEGLKDVSAGLPSEVLLRRPDILQAEHQLKAAYANIAAARASFFPRITLTGGGGFLSGALSELFSLRARTWEFAPQVTLPIFDAGALKANYGIAQADRDIVVAEYEKAIQTAFREVSDALSQRSRLMEQQKAQQALVDTFSETYRLTEARYKAGIDNYLNVLVAQRSLYSGQQALVGVRLARLSNLVTLYTVLGGGAQ